MSYKHTLRTKYARNRVLVMGLLEMGDDAYRDFVFERGRAYIHSFIGDNDEAYSVLVKSPVFWDWFVNQWNLADRVWIEEIVDRIGPLGVQDGAQLDVSYLKLMAEYYAIHSLGDHRSRVYPNTALIGEILKKAK